MTSESSEKVVDDEAEVAQISAKTLAVHNYVDKVLVLGLENSFLLVQLAVLLHVFGEEFEKVDRGHVEPLDNGRVHRAPLRLKNRLEDEKLLEVGGGGEVFLERSATLEVMYMVILLFEFAESEARGEVDELYDDEVEVLGRERRESRLEVGEDLVEEEGEVQGRESEDFLEVQEAVLDQGLEFLEVGELYFQKRAVLQLPEEAVVIEAELEEQFVAAVSLVFLNLSLVDLNPFFVEQSKLFEAVLRELLLAMDNCPGKLQDPLLELSRSLRTLPLVVETEEKHQFEGEVD